MALHSSGCADRRGFVRIDDVQHPHGGAPVAGWFAQSLLKNWAKHRPTDVKNCELAILTLQQPDRVYRGVRELPDFVANQVDGPTEPGFTEGWYCYSRQFKGREVCVAAFRKRYARKLDYECEEFPLDKVYVAYLDASLQVFGHEVVEADEADGCAPEGPEDRFGERTWMRQA